MDEKTRKYLRWTVIVLCVVYIVYLHLQRMGYMKSFRLIREEAELLQGTASYRVAPKEIQDRVRRIGSISSDVLNIPRQEKTLSDIARKSR